MPPLPTGVTARQRDAVRVDVARVGVQSALSSISPGSYLERLETDVALFDVHTDLDIARRHLTNAAEALRRIADGLRS